MCALLLYVTSSHYGKSSSSDFKNYEFLSDFRRTFTFQFILMNFEVPVYYARDFYSQNSVWQIIYPVNGYWIYFTTYLNLSSLI